MLSGSSALVDRYRAVASSRLGETIVLASSFPLEAKNANALRCSRSAAEQMAPNKACEISRPGMPALVTPDPRARPAAPPGFV